MKIYVILTWCYQIRGIASQLTNNSISFWEKCYGIGEILPRNHVYKLFNARNTVTTCCTFTAGLNGIFMYSKLQSQV